MSIDPFNTRVKWPPAWNPFHVFLLALALVSSLGLLQGHSGSKVLDERLNQLAVTLWGAALGVGALLAILGVFCYRDRRRLMPGLYLERAGCVLVGSAASIYTFVVVVSASDVAGVWYTASIQVAFAMACFFRAWQAHTAIRFTQIIYRALRTTEERP